MNCALPKIALFDDDAANLRMYQNFFKDHFAVNCFQNPFFYPQALAEDVSAILIDVVMPVMDGLKLHEEVRKHHHFNGCPIIFISSTGSDQVLLNALSAGGQDFLTRSMTREEMVTRIKNKIEHFKGTRLIYRLGKVKLNMGELRANCDGNVVDLTLTELKIMKFLIREYPLLSPKEDIVSEVWPEQKVMPSTLSTHLSNLRQKFTDWEYDIQIVKLKGIELVLRK